MRLFPDPTVQDCEESISSFFRSGFVPRRVRLSDFDCDFGVKVRHVVFCLSYPSKRSFPMTLEQERRAYNLFVEVSCLALAERVAWLESLCEELPVREEIRSLLALEAEQISADIHPATAAMKAIGQSLFGGEELIGKTLGSYRIENQVRDTSGRHKGGMGFVYQARRADGAYDQTVAVKVIQWPRASERERELFLRERELLARLQHPNIVKIFDAGSLPDGRPYYVMDWVEGGTDFTEYCQTRDLSVRHRIELFIVVCSAVSRAHRSQVLHRDLKPSNIQVDKYGVPKLLDFGLSSPLGEQATRDLARSLLTPAYASPEQLRGEDLSESSDVYSLGVVLFETLWGERPQGVLPSTSKPVCNTRDVFEPELAAVVGQMLAEDPNGRIQTVDAVQRELSDWLSCRTVAAYRAKAAFPAAYVARKFVRRNFILTTLVTAMVGTLAAGFVSVVRERDEALRQRERATGEQVRAERGERDANTQRLRAEASSQVARAQTRLAQDRQIESERQRNIAVARELAAIAQLQVDSGEMATGALLAIESSRLRESFEANQVARKAQRYLPDRIWRVSLPHHAHRLQFSLNGRYVAISHNQQGIAVVRSADSGNVVLSATHGLNPGCRPPNSCGTVEIAFHPTRAECATSGQDGAIRIWNLHDRKLVRELIVPRTGLHRLEYWRDGTLAASLDRFRSGIFNQDTGTLRASYVTDGELPVLSADGKFYIVEQRSHEAEGVSVRDVRTNNEIARIVPANAGDLILRTRLNPARPQAAVFVGQNMKTARLALVNLESPKGDIRANSPFEPVFNLNGPGTLYDRLLGEERLRFQFSGGGRYLVAFNDEDGAVVDTITAKLLKTWPLRAQIESFVEASTLLTPPGSEEIRTYSLPDLRLSSVLQEDLDSIALSPSGRYFAVAGKKGTLELWSPHDPVRIAEAGPAAHAVFSPDSKYLASVHRSGALVVQSVVAEKQVFADQLEPVVEELAALPGVAFSSSGKYLAVHVNDLVVLFATDPWSRLARSEVLNKATSMFSAPSAPRFLDGERWLEQAADKTNIFSLPDLRPVYQADRGSLVRAVTPHHAIVSRRLPREGIVIDVLSLPSWTRVQSFESALNPHSCSANEAVLVCGTLKAGGTDSAKIGVWTLPDGRLIGTMPVTEVFGANVLLSGGRIVVHGRNTETPENRPDRICDSVLARCLTAAGPGDGGVPDDEY